MIRNPIVVTLGLIFGAVMASMLPVLMDMGMEEYNMAFPVADSWKILVTQVDGDDVLLSGTMIKHRDCLYMPPPLARDIRGTSHAVVSQSMTAGANWDADPHEQTWGPWRVVGGAGRQLFFSIVYMCGGNRPAIVALGVYHPPGVLP